MFTSLQLTSILRRKLYLQIYGLRDCNKNTCNHVIIKSSSIKKNGPIKSRILRSRDSLITELSSPKHESRCLHNYIPIPRTTNNKFYICSPQNTQNIDLRMTTYIGISISDFEVKERMNRYVKVRNILWASRLHMNK